MLLLSKVEAVSHNTRAGNHLSSASPSVASSLLQVAPSHVWSSQRSPFESMSPLLVGMPYLRDRG